MSRTTNPDWDGVMKGKAREPKGPRPIVTWSKDDELRRKYLILRAALEAIYGTTETTLAACREVAHVALEQTD